MINQQVYFKGIRNEIIKLLESAQSEIKIAVAWITDEKIIRILEKISIEGVDISIIFYDDRVNDKSLFHGLLYSGAEIRCSKNLMHNKFCIIDSNLVINGSYNWTKNAESNNENILVTSGNYQLAKKFEDEFYKLFERCKSIEPNLTFFNEAQVEQDNFEEYFKNTISQLFSL